MVEQEPRGLKGPLAEQAPLVYPDPQATRELQGTQAQRDLQADQAPQVPLASEPSLVNLTMLLQLNAFCIY